MEAVATFTDSLPVDEYHFIMYIRDGREFMKTLWKMMGFGENVWKSCGFFENSTKQLSVVGNYMEIMGFHENHGFPMRIP